MFHKTVWDATPKYPQNEWVLCSEDWQDVVITYIPQLNDTPIEDNYADISLNEIKDAYFKHSGKKNHARNNQNNF